MTMTRFQLNRDGSYANKIGTGEWHHVKTSSEFLAWLEAGNTPEPAPKAPRPVKLTPAEKLKAVGLTVEELKALLAG
jgi:hypothetical protein